MSPRNARQSTPFAVEGTIVWPLRDHSIPAGALWGRRTDSSALPSVGRPTSDPHWPGPGAGLDPQLPSLAYSGTWSILVWREESSSWTLKVFQKLLLLAVRAKARPLSELHHV